MLSQRLRKITAKCVDTAATIQSDFRGEIAEQMWLYIYIYIYIYEWGHTLWSYRGYIHTLGLIDWLMIGRTEEERRQNACKSAKDIFSI